MTTNKDFKRLVRSRMVKTGESYTSARAQMVKGAPVGKWVSGKTPAHLPTVPLADLAGMSDAKVKAATGCTWEKWVQALDYKKASTWSHREIAQYVHDTFKVPSWWTQTVTVGYERIKGLREKGQRRDGGFEANKSKTVAAPLSKLYHAFNDKRRRNQWLPGVDLTIRSKTPNKYMSLIMPDRTVVLVGFTGKGAGKSQVAIAHGKLPDKAAAERSKEYWGARLGSLAELLSN